MCFSTVDLLKEHLLEIKDSSEAIELLDRFIIDNPENEEAYILRGLRHWGLGNRSKAINDYLAAIRINPESRARQALEMATGILDYRNKDLYNP